MQDLTLTLLQTELAWQDAAANRAHFGELIRSLPEPTDLVILPEMFTTGFTMATREFAETMDGPTTRWLAELAAECRVTVCGSLIVEAGGRYYNRLLWMPPDGQVGHYDKRHLFQMAGEHEHFAPGSRREIFSLNGWRICPLICYDLRFPVWSRGANAFDLLIYTANWPAARRSAWRTLLPARAVENQCYVAGLNRIGRDGNGIDYAGDSGVFDYLGETLADLGNRPGHCTLTLRRAALDRYREKFPAYQDADDFRLL